MANDNSASYQRVLNRNQQGGNPVANQLVRTIGSLGLLSSERDNHQPASQDSSVISYSDSDLTLLRCTRGVGALTVVFLFVGMLVWTHTRDYPNAPPSRDFKDLASDPVIVSCWLFMLLYMAALGVVAGDTAGRMAVNCRELCRPDDEEQFGGFIEPTTFLEEQQSPEEGEIVINSDAEKSEEEQDQGINPSS